MKFSCPSCRSTYLNTDALWQYGKWAHPLGLQTQFKECLCLYVMTKKLVSLDSDIRAYKRSHLVRNLSRSQIILLPGHITIFSINQCGVISTSTVHQGFYLIADDTVLFYLIHHFQGCIVQTLTECLWGADWFSSSGAAMLWPNILWSTPPVQKSTIETTWIESPSMQEIVCVWQICNGSSTVSSHCTLP